MADETTTTVAAWEQTADASAATENTGTAAAAPVSIADAEHMIPKSRFDEVNKKLRELEKAQTESERKAAEAQGHYKELWEKSQADAAKAVADAQAAKQETLRLRVTAQVPGFPAAWADRLRGETEEDMLTDAKALMAAMPKPAAPNANGAPGDGSKPTPGQLNDVERAEIAAIYNVNPKYMT